MSEDIEITDEGKTTRGKYYVWGDHDGYSLVTVISDEGRAKTTHVGGSPAEVTAQRLLIELVKIKQSSAAVATSRASHRSPRSDREGQNQ